ncbi:MAG: signal peptidase I [Myxococcota bacterium]|nr:signal peptidase I [Myxococcota bacterium]
MELPEVAKKRRARRAVIAFAAMTAIGVLLVAGLLALRVAFAPYELDGPAMEPTYFDGDRVAVERGADIARGDVVIIRRPEEGIDIVKRVIAIGGDHVAIEDDVIVLNGERIEPRLLGPAQGEDPEMICAEERLGDASWRIVWSETSAPSSTPEQAISAGHVFVLGDHRDRSNDSRNPRIGAVPLDQVLGRVTSTYAQGPQTVSCP